MENCYILRKYSKEKQIVVCKVCNRHKKVKNNDLKDYKCCTIEKWEHEKSYDIYRKSALKRKLNFELTKYEFEHLIGSRCFYCKVEPRKMKDGMTRNGIDRINNDIGYTRQNTICSCTSCNFMKRTKTFEQFRKDIGDIFHNLNDIAENKDEILGYGMLYNAGYTDIDLKMCLALHAKGLIKLDKSLIEKYISSISNTEDLKIYIKTFSGYLGAGFNSKNLDIKVLRTALCTFVTICAECITEGKLKISTISEGFSRNENTKQVMIDIVPYSRMI